MLDFFKKRKDYLVLNWFILNSFRIFLNKVLGVGSKNIRVVSGTEIEVSVVSQNLYPLIFFLNKHSLCSFKSVMEIVCYDTIGKSYRFFLVYNLLSVRNNMRFRVLTKVNESDKLLSLVSLYRSVGWSEREVFDFFGLFFFENKDLRKILTDYGFKGFPLRKDFPLTGYVDIYYDDNQKCICYQSLELSQEYRDFKFESSWKIHN